MGTMEFSTYQQRAAETAIYPRNEEGLQLLYCALGLAGEAGEVANKVKKIIRDDGGQLTEDRRNQLLSELGDVLWYVAALATECQLTLGEVAIHNLDKLAARRVSNKLRGAGDLRELAEGGSE
jgi:NTP pyrophosphatase (non-canonical NTP hydrolase)